MAVELVTGFAGYGSDGAPNRHVSSSEDGARQAGTVGMGMYVMKTVDDPLAATLENSNTVTVGAGDVLMNGRHVQLTGSTSFAIPVGTQAMQTSNLLVLRYTLEDNGVESVEALTLTGSPAESNPQDPAINSGSILDGDSPVDMPLYRVVTTGIDTAQPVRLFDSITPIADLAFADIGGTLPVDRGGTGATTASAARANIKAAGIESAVDAAFIGQQASSEQGCRIIVNGEQGNKTVFFNESGAIGYYDNDKGETIWAYKFENLWRYSYPVGSVYISFNSTSPASLFGGSWTRINGYFPYFGNDTEPGGSNTHTLTTSQMPAHSHTPGNSNNSAGVGFWQTNANTGKEWYVLSRERAGAVFTLTIGNTGGGRSHNNMPKYQSMYAWRRTA